MKRLFSVIDAAIKWLTYFSSFVLFLMMANIAVDVLLRYVIGKPLPLTLEMVSYYYMVGVAFIPLALVERKNGHISVDLLVQFFPAIVRRLIESAMALVGAGLFALIAWVTLQNAIAKLSIGEYVMGDYSLPIWPARFALPVGFALFALVLLLKGVIRLAGREAPPADEDAAEAVSREGAQ